MDMASRMHVTCTCACRHACVASPRRSHHSKALIDGAVPGRLRHAGQRHPAPHASRQARNSRRTTGGGGGMGSKSLCCICTARGLLCTLRWASRPSAEMSQRRHAVSTGSSRALMRGHTCCSIWGRDRGVKGSSSATRAPPCGLATWLIRGSSSVRCGRGLRPLRSHSPVRAAPQLGGSAGASPQLDGSAGAPPQLADSLAGEA